MNDEFAASLIVVSKNRATGLRRSLDYVQAIRAHVPFEVILVDNASTDDTNSVMKQFAREFNAPTKILTADRPGNSAGRNEAIKVAAGDLLLFIDDDCYVQPDFVDAWVEVFASNQIGFATGSISRHDPKASMLGCQVVNSPVLWRRPNFIPRGLVQGSNMAFSADCLRDVGVFDERFGAGTAWAGEEWDLAIRAMRKGWEGGLFPGPVVAHDHGRSGDDADRRMLFYDYGAGAVYAKHALTAIAPRAVRALAGETWRLRRERERAKALVRGALSYLTQPSAFRT